MKKWTYILAAISVLAFGISDTGWSVQNPGIGNTRIGSPGIVNPGIRNPAGLSTVPPSSLQDGLVTSPNPFARTGNDAITGNLRGGKSFGAGIPYRSTSSFWGYATSTNEAINLVTVGGPFTRANTLLGPTPDSATLDSFLRNSAGWEDFGTYSGKYGDPQYYVRKYPVTRSAPGLPGVFKPAQSPTARRTPGVYGLEALDARKKALQKQQVPKSPLAMRTTPLTTEEIRQLASGQVRITPMNKPLAGEQYQKQMDRMRLDLMNLRSKKVLPKPPTAEDAEKEDLLSLLPLPGGKRPELDEGRAEIQALLSPIDEPAPEDAKGLPGSDMLQKGALDKLLSSYTQMQPGVMQKPEEGATVITSNLERLADQIANLRRKDSGLGVAEPLQVGVAKTDLRSVAVLGTGLESSRLPGGELPTTGTLPTMPDINKRLTPDITLDQGEETPLTETEKLKNLSDLDVAIRAKQIRGGHKSHESYRQARYEQYLTEAQAQLKQGKFYLAASAFAQASIFDSKKPAALAGRGLALFGAGEYVSSALFLSRAIEMSDEYAWSKIDLAATMGDMDRLEIRIADAEEWLERSCAPELEFVLAYMYYNSGRLEPAKRAIESAEKEMPESKAIKTLKKAIAGAPRPSKKK